MRVPEAGRRRLARRLGVPGLVGLNLVGPLTACGASHQPPRATGRLPASYIPLSVGRGRSYRPDIRPKSSALNASAVGVADLTCNRGLGRRFGVHIELFASRHVVLVPSGIGIFRPARPGPIIPSVGCYYPVVTLDPTGVVEVADSARPATLGTVFALWGHSLSSTRLAGFHGPVHVYVNGRPVGGDPSRIKLARHDEIVLEVSGYVLPHAAYRFPNGL